MFSIALALALSLLMAYAFAFINGVHDTANAIATTVATRALSPRTDANLIGGVFIDACLA